MKSKIYTAEEVWAFRGANCALVLDLDCTQIWLPTMCTSLDFSFFFFWLNALVVLFFLSLVSMDSLFSFLLTYRMEELSQRESFIFHALKVLRK